MNMQRWLSLLELHRGWLMTWINPMNYHVTGSLRLAHSSMQKPLKPTLPAIRS
jgi:hypothetical protein